MNSDKNHIGYIYKYTSPSQKIYIGQTTGTIRYRAGRNGIKYRSNGNTLFWKAINKYGFEKFILDILVTINAKTKLELIERLNTSEKYFINKYQSNNPKNGYNLTDGGNNYVMSDYARKKFSEKMKGRKLSPAHVESIRKEMYRRWEEGVFTDDRNKKVSESNKHKKTIQHAKNISIGRKKSMKENPDKFAYLKSPEFKGHRFKPGHARTKGSLGMKWYNDGVRNYLCLPKYKKQHYKVGMIKK